MARRTRRKQAPRRRQKQGVNIINAAQSYVVASATTKALFDMDLMPWLTEGWLTGQTTASNNSWELSAYELARGMLGGSYGQASSWGGGFAGVAKAVKYNLKNNPQAVATLVVAPAAFKVAKKLTAKPRRDANRLLKMTGLNTVVKV
jgi:hypothetical protein